MQTNNVTELKNFYDTQLGKFTCRKLRHKISGLWHEMAGEKILGLGFALPYLPLFSYGNSLVAFMPANIGAMKIEDASATVMVNYESLPAKNEYFDRAVVIHGIENCQVPEKLIEEMWRVLKPGGRLMIIAPNENGFWQRLHTPFYKTRGYTRIRLHEYLIFNKFMPRRFKRALFFIPTGSRIVNRVGEILGAIFLRQFCGVLIIEAEKVIFATGGRPIKIPVSLWDRLLKPKEAAV